jgi:hypothetical protein
MILLVKRNKEGIDRRQQKGVEVYHKGAVDKLTII